MHALKMNHQGTDGMEDRIASETAAEKVRKKMVTLKMSDLTRELTAEELQELEEAEKKPEVYDSDSPKMTTAQLMAFKRNIKSGLITARSRFSDHGRFCTGPASFFHPRRAPGCPGEEGCGRRRSPASAALRGGTGGRVDASGEKQRGPCASGRHTRGHPRRRADDPRSRPYDSCSRPAPVRISRGSRESGRAAEVSWA